MRFARLVRAELDALADDVNKLPNCKQISRTARPVHLSIKGQRQLAAGRAPVKSVGTRYFFLSISGRPL